MPSAHTLINADGLTKHYRDVIALDGVSFTISEGITGILGENGAGKSTAIRIMLGLIRPTSGSATVLGENASESVAVRARLGYMPEHDCLPSHVSAAEFLTHMAEVSGLPPSTARTRAADTLRHAGLFEVLLQVRGGRPPAEHPPSCNRIDARVGRAPFAATDHLNSGVAIATSVVVFGGFLLLSIRRLRRMDVP